MTRFNVSGFRIIPTCVGKSGPRSLRMLRPSDHPHVRGEKTRHFMSVCLLSGSSPRAWGKVHHQIQGFRVSRIIPTCVGKRPRHTGTASTCSDHPHVRGEKETHDDGGCAGRGSSPRAWGKGYGGEQGIRRRRIIPTCVGKSSACVAS